MDGSPSPKYPVVLRFAGMFPHQLGKFQMHGRREGGDLGHIDMSRFDPNRPPLIGGVDWLEKAHAEVEWMRTENFADELASLEKRRRKADVIRRTSEGPKDPWRASRHGPMREVILTANKEFFGDGLENFFGETSNVDSFRELAVSWLKENFGEDCIHARDDLDEEAYHIHAIIMPRVNEVMTRKAKNGEVQNIASRYMLQPSKHPLIKDYEAAQDSVGIWFSGIGLVRGEPRKKAWRDAVAKGEEPPKKRQHVKPRVWREQEEARLDAKRTRADERKAELDQQQRITAQRIEAVTRRETQVAEREADAEAILTVAEAVAQGAMQVDEAGAVKWRPSERSRPEVASAIAAGQRRPKAVKRLFATLGKAVARMRGDLATQIEADVRSEYQDGFDALSSAREVAVDLVATLEPSLRPRAQSKLTLLKQHLSAAGHFAARVIVRRDRQAEKGPRATNEDKRDDL
ncbi:Pre (Mob) type recombination enzyme [Thioclava sp. 'Guangxiensis']|uniref:Pre (Mob) type recombination enzyme n=1 Tax=Thioclava sp. 'Guangxiensis' TaxID=3149044 RepID=UPI003877A848